MRAVSTTRPPGGRAEGRERGHSGPLDPQWLTELAETFRLLGDTTRVRILDLLSTAECCVQDIAHRLGLTASAVSHQLRLLRGQRLVRPRRVGRQVFYVLDDHHIVELFAQGLEHVQERHRPQASPRRQDEDASS